MSAEGGGGGAIFVRGGTLKVVNSQFLRNRCDRVGPDLGGAAIRALSQSKGQPISIVNSTFLGGECSNGGALSSIGVAQEQYQTARSDAVPTRPAQARPEEAAAAPFSS